MFRATFCPCHSEERSDEESRRFALFPGDPSLTLRMTWVMGGIFMEVPVLIDGREAGRLRIARDGLYTVLEAELPGRAGEIVRLWVHGGEKSAYLGVMQPWSRGLWLRRRLSRAELREFPDPIEYAADRAGEPAEASAEIPTAPAPEPGEEGLLWTRRPDGTLTAFDGVSRLIALPAKLRTPNPRAVERVIEGQKYLVFRY